MSFSVASGRVFSVAGSVSGALATGTGLRFGMEIEGPEGGALGAFVVCSVAIEALNVSLRFWSRSRVVFWVFDLFVWMIHNLWLGVMS